MHLTFGGLILRRAYFFWGGGLIIGILWYSFTFCSDFAELFQAFEQQAEVLKALDVKITALQNSLSAKDMELHQVSKFPV